MKTPRHKQTTPTSKKLWNTYLHVFFGVENIKTPNIPARELIANGLLIAFFFGTIGIALKFTTFFDHWVYFPSFPNTLDSVFLILSSAYFLIYIFRKKTAGSSKQAASDEKARC